MIVGLATTPDGFLVDIGDNGDDSIMTRLRGAITRAIWSRRDPYAVMLPKTTLEEIEAEVRPGIPVDTNEETVYGLEIIRCTHLPGGRRYVLLYDS